MPRSSVRHVISLKQLIMKTARNDFREYRGKQSENVFRALFEIQIQLELGIEKDDAYSQEFVEIVRSIDALFEQMVRK